jgi:geranylgeranyl diphosphate synthase type II
VPAVAELPPRTSGLDDYLALCKDACGGEIERLYGSGEPGTSGLRDLILDYPLRGGKALRPALSIATCLGLGGHLEAVLPTAATLELYHNAFLIHDDIEDDSWRRRGRPTLHVEHGIPIAVNVGDAMLSLSLQPLLDNVERIGLGPALRILRAVAHMTRQTVEGQAIELEWVRSNIWQLADADYLRMVELKTSWYSFITPLQAGAITAGGGGPDQLAPLEVLGRHLGAAFQITDDLLNLRGDPQDYGKEIGGDLWEGKRTLMVLHALRHADPDDRERAVEILAKRRPSAAGEVGLADLLDRLTARGELSRIGRDAIAAQVLGLHEAESKTLDDIRWLYRLLHRTRSLTHAREVAARHARAAATVLAGLDWLPPSQHRDMLAGLVDYVHGRTR